MGNRLKKNNNTDYMAKISKYVKQSTTIPRNTTAYVDSYKRIAAVFTLHTRIIFSIFISHVSRGKHMGLCIIISTNRWLLRYI